MPPRGDGQPASAGEFDEALHRHMVEAIEVIDTDAAADESAAARALRASFPNLKLIVKDHTHGSVRTHGNKTRAPPGGAVHCKRP